MNLHHRITQAIPLFLITACLSFSVSAQDEDQSGETENAEATTTALINEPRFISDVLFVPLRSGPTTGHRIVHKGLKSGSQVTLLQKGESDWVLVKTSRGIEGWIRSRYLFDKPTASLQLKEARKQIDQLSAKAGPLSEQLLNAEKDKKDLKRTIKSLEQENNKVSKELQRITELSGDQVRLDQDNKNLIQNNEELRNRVDTLKAENTRLSEQLKSDDFMYGALTIILGAILTLGIQNITRTRRRSEWS